MKRTLIAAAALGSILLLVSATRAADPVAPASFVPGHDACPAASDDTPPVDCPFCGGDPLLHSRRMNNIAVTSSRLAYRLLDSSLF